MRRSSPRRDTALVTVVDTFSDETQAQKAMHRCAERIKRRHEQKRYGVFIEKQAGVWYLCLVDRRR